MKNKWRNYALKDGKIKKSYLSKHQNRDERRQTPTPSSCDRNEQSGQKQAEEEIEMLTRPELPLCLSELVEQEVKWYQEAVGLVPPTLNDEWVDRVNKLYNKE